MSKFNFQIQFSAIFGTNAPSIDLYLEDQIISSETITASFGSLNTFTYTFDFSGTAPSNLFFRFNDTSSEVGRVVVVESIEINGQNIENSNLTIDDGGILNNAGKPVIGQSETVAINTTLADYLFGLTEPTLEELGFNPSALLDSVIVAENSADNLLLGDDISDDFIRGRNGDDKIVGQGGNDTLFGNAGNDIISGGSGNDNIGGYEDDDLLYGGDGDDVVRGHTGRDTINGGDGNDTLLGGDDNDIIFGGEDNDRIFGDDGNDSVNGGSGDDLIYGGIGNDTLDGGEGKDIVLSGEGDDTVSGGLGIDALFGEAGNDIIYGEGGNDSLRGDAGDDQLYGGAGSDRILGGADNDEIYGGDNDDRLFGDAGHDTINGDAGSDSIYGGDGNDTINGGSGIDLILGDSGNDILSGGDDNDSIQGGSGSDTLNGDSGNDRLFGNEDNDTLYGGDGNDRLDGGVGADVIYGGSGNDTLILDFNDTYDGGTGFDILRLGAADNTNLILTEANVTIFNNIDMISLNNLGTIAVNTLSISTSLVDEISGTNSLYITGNENLDIVTINDVSVDTDFVGITNAGGISYEHYQKDGNSIFVQLGLNSAGPGSTGASVISGSNESQTLNGTLANEVILGLDGDDIINTNGGNDEVLGGAGDDTITGANNEETFYGGDGNDTLRGLGSNDRLFGGEGSDKLYGGDGQDILRGDNGNDDLFGDAETDQLYGGFGSDRLYGGDGNDHLHGENGSDILNGDIGNDRLYGGDGADILNGGLGNDILIGGDSTDTDIDLINGGGGHDKIIYRANDQYNGGTGYDTVIVDEAASFDIDFSSFAFTDGAIDHINLTNYSVVGVYENTLTINIDDVLSNTDHGWIYISGDGGIDNVISNTFNAENITGTRNFQNTTYDIYKTGGATLFLQQDLALSYEPGVELSDDVLNTLENTALIINASDLLVNDATGIDGDSLTVTSISSGTLGLVSQIDATTWSYTPGNGSGGGLNGTDTLTYTVTNSLGTETQGIITVVVGAVNDGLVANDDHFNRENTNLFSGNVLNDNGNGSDIDLDGDTITVTTVGTFLTNLGNTVQIQANGDFVFIPTANFVGDDFFDYDITDGNGSNATGRLSASIVPEDVIALPTHGLVDVLDSPSFGDYNNPELYANGPYTQKTIALAIETGTDITSRQVVYEQGQATRGINIFIENGEIFFSVWNYAEENWGYVETSADITASTSLTVAMVMDGNIGATGSLTGFIDGLTVSQSDGVGVLYNHSISSIGQTQSQAVFHDVVDQSLNQFSGSVKKVALYNEALDASNIDNLHEALLSPDITPVLLVENALINTTNNDPAINDSGPYEQKTLGATFTTGNDVNTTQVIYEQGGTVRGMNVFIDSGKAYVAMWNFAEENWGYREFSTDVIANTEYTATLILDGIQNETGALIGFFNGLEVGRFNDVGLLYSHPGNIGFEQMQNDTVIHNSVVNGDGLAFSGELKTIVQYNEAILDGNAFGQLQSFLNSDADASPFLKPSSGLATVSDDVLLYTDSIDNAIGGDGFDMLIATEGLTDLITSTSYDGIELINLDQGGSILQADIVQVDINNVLSTENDLLIVLGDSDDEVISTDFSIEDRVADVVSSGVSYAAFEDSNATLYIELGMLFNGNTLI